MIDIEFFTYSDEEWDQIRTVVRDGRGCDADQIKRRITPIIGQYNITGVEPLRSRIETAASLYPLHSATSRRSLRRDELDRLRQDAEKLRASIIGALAVPIRTKGNPLVHPLLLNGVDADMVTTTSEYFRKLNRNIDRQIKRAGSRRDNARKTDRDQFWSELLAIWIELGGEPSGVAAARFLLVASKPVMGAVKDDAVLKWLERRRITR
jgi:hypothetical protein